MDASTYSGIAIEDMDAAYNGQVVLREVNLQIGQGDMVAIIGPNGSGKSTLLRTIGRLLRPNRGAVYLDGKPLRESSPTEVARRMSVLPQAPPAPSELTVRELVGYGRYPHVPWMKRFGNQDTEIIEKTINTCDLEELADRKLATLSGGERQRAWIAMALAQQPQVMLLDEPVTFLDIGHQLEVMDLVVELNRSERITVVAVLHDLNLAARYCPRLIAMKDGRVHSSGAAREVIQADVLEDVFGIGVYVGEDPLTRQPICHPYRLQPDARSYKARGASESVTDEAHKEGGEHVHRNQ